MYTHRPTSLPILVLALVAGCAAVAARPAVPAAVVEAQSADAPVALPNREGSLKFMVIGDFGNGSREQMQLAEQMVKAAREVSVRSGDHGRRQHLRVEQRRRACGSGSRFPTSRCWMRASSSMHRSAITTIASCSASTPRSTWAASCTTRGRRRAKTCGSSRWRAATRPCSRLAGSNVKCSPRTRSGRSRTSTIRSTRQQSGMARVTTCRRSSSRSSSRTT